jgi:hypothetical protein
VPAGVRVLGTEGRPEGVDLGERQAIGLDVELPRDRQERLAAKEILCEIDPALGCAREVGEIQGRDPEQRPSESDDVLTGMLTQKNPDLVEEPVDLTARVVWDRRAPRCAGAFSAAAQPGGAAPLSLRRLCGARERLLAAERLNGVLQRLHARKVQGRSRGAEAAKFLGQCRHTMAVAVRETGGPGKARPGDEGAEGDGPAAATPKGDSPTVIVAVTISVAVGITETKLSSEFAT